MSNGPVSLHGDKHTPHQHEVRNCLGPDCSFNSLTELGYLPKYLAFSFCNPGVAFADVSILWRWEMRSGSLRNKYIEGKNLLLKMPHISDTRLREMKLELL